MQPDPDAVPVAGRLGQLTDPVGIVLDEAAQAAGLQRSRRRATGLLVIVAAGFIATFWLPDTTGTGYLRAALEAGLVGGLADWFAVVALFRHPLGIPIPHTAVIARSKHGLGANIATFVRRNFLGADQLRERLVDPSYPHRLGEWLAAPDHAQRVAVWLCGLAASAADGLDEDATVERAVSAVRARLAHVPLGPLVARSVEDAVTAHRHDQLVTAGVEGLIDVLARNRTALRRRLRAQSPGWVPAAIDDLVFDRAEQVARSFLQQVADEPDHELRRALDEQLTTVVERLRHEPQLQERLHTALAAAVSDDLLRATVRAWLRQARRQLDLGAEADAVAGAGVRAVVADAVVDLGARLRDDPVFAERILAALEAFAPRVAAYAEAEAGELITATIDRWDADDTARRLELWMGRDLQFVRINGTVVGALVGLGLYGVSELLG